MGVRVADEAPRTDAPVVIKKYANRRLYNTQTSSYVTLDHLCNMVKQGIEFEVRDARTNDDITRSVLTQIIIEEEAKGPGLLPIRFLRQLIRFYGDSMQSFVPGYLDLSMDSFIKNQEEMRARIAQVFGGGSQAVESLVHQNLALFDRAMQMFTPLTPPRRVDDVPPHPVLAVPAAEEIHELKGEIEEMRRQIAELSQRK